MPGVIRKKRISSEMDIQDAPSRRATRQSSTAPLPVPEDPEPRRRRRRVESEAEEEPPITIPIRKPRTLHGKENVPVSAGDDLPKPTRSTRHSAGLEAVEPYPPTTNSQPTQILLPVPAISPTSPVTPRPVGRPPGRPPSNAPTMPPNRSVTVGRNKPITMATSASQPTQQPPRLEAAASTKTSDRKSAAKNTQTDRNIDKVVLGDICFKTWYPSYFGKEVLDNGPGILDRLYVCPCCFKYSKELVSWWEHVQICKGKNFIPGSKIYTHPKGQRTVLKASGPPPKSGRGRKSNASQKMVEEVVQDQGEWSIWEVDGEVDVLFCQNLSLFAKLFLDNKSVFFDVTGFKYFLLVYTPPAVAARSLLTPPEHPTLSGPSTAAHQPRSQIVGFFSKEKMSWDNNNLACILVFPPWQRKGLGSLLMGVSYEISKREGLLGGPEKPISELGKKGYKRFWAGEIARWILSLPATSNAIEPGKEVLAVDVSDCSQATWIVPEDCLAVLREMGVVEDAGFGPVVKQSSLGKPMELSELGVPIMPPDEASTNKEKEGSPEQEEAPVQQRRVKINQQAVMEWVQKNRISLAKACDPDGFVEGYAMKKEDELAVAEESG
ncbi:putative histone acetyltransferase [Triangularia verruculosa]|uniref:histone acetyltransferase n=1 Tax=Triangularia verruculosa TaxID=2587418 RepID=A0AAN6X6J1_9PEZI|nr:putative histone acetyltransferase [Triangularia verruculosa]